MIRKETVCLIVAAVLVAGSALSTRFAHRPEPRVKPEHIRGVLELAPLADTSKALIIGYHYHLLKRFAADNGQTIDISLTQQCDTLVFTSDNTNNPKPTKDRSGSGIGLENTRRRFNLLYSGHYQWEQTITPENIYHVKITLQL